MARSVGLAHVVRQPDETFVGMWSTYVLKSAFQPIFAFQNGKLSAVAFEGLLRPFRNDGPIAPGVFFGLTPPIDRMHVETLSRTLHLLNAGRFLDRAASVFVNFDPSVFSDRQLTDAALRDMRLVLHEADIAPERVVCEVTEQPSASETTLFSFVQALREHGFEIAVDDYGSESSDIQRIERLKPDIVKFDARWVATLMNSAPGLALLQEVVDRFLAKGIRTVFEGIEHSWQVELAEKCRTSMVQGYALARPSIMPDAFPSRARDVVKAIAVEQASPVQVASMSAAAQRGKVFGLRRA